MNNLNFANFDVMAIVYENGKVFVNAEPLREFLQVAPRSFSRLLANLKEVEFKVARHIIVNSRRRSVWMLTVKGVRFLIDNIKLTNVSNRCEMKADFNAFYENYITTRYNDNKVRNTGCGMLDLDLSPGSCIYLIRIKENYYKLGETDDIKKRLQQHKVEFNYEEVIKVFPCPHKTASQEIERDLKKMLNLLGYMVQYPKKNDTTKFHCEIFKTDNSLELIIQKFTETINLQEMRNDKRADQYIGIQKGKLLEMHHNNHNRELDIEKIRNEALIDSNKILTEIVNKMGKELDILKTRVVDLENYRNDIENSKQKIAIERIVIDTPKNRPELKLDIDIDALIIFVKRSFILDIDNTVGKKKLETRLMTTIYQQYMTSAESKREFYTVLYSCLKTVFGHNPKYSKIGKFDKDIMYGYSFVYAPLAEFIKQNCECGDKNVSENVENFRVAYEEYCTANNCFGFVSELPEEMERLGYKNRVLKIGGKRHIGIYLIDNRIKEFIHTKCTIGDNNTYASILQIETSYLAYCSENKILMLYSYDRSTIKHILVTMGFKILYFNNNCINIQGLTVTGEDYARKKRPPPALLAAPLNIEPVIVPAIEPAIEPIIKQVIMPVIKQVIEQVIMPVIVQGPVEIIIEWINQTLYAESRQLTALLYNDYEIFCKQQGRKTGSKIMLFKHLKAIGVIVGFDREVCKKEGKCVATAYCMIADNYLHLINLVTQYTEHL